MIKIMSEEWHRTLSVLEEELELGTSKLSAVERVDQIARLIKPKIKGWLNNGLHRREILAFVAIYIRAHGIKSAGRAMKLRSDDEIIGFTDLMSADFGMLIKGDPKSRENARLRYRRIGHKKPHDREILE